MIKLARITVSVFLFVALLVLIVTLIKGASVFGDLWYSIGPSEFETRVASGQDWIGPSPGSRIEIEHLAGRDGVSLNFLTHSQIALLAVVEPTCGACTISRDQYKVLDAELKKIGVDYFIVSFSSKHSAQDVSEYATKLGVNTTSFAWTEDSSTLPPSLNMIAYPSHILIDSDGTVLETFPGTSLERNLRTRLVNEIISEVKRRVKGP